MKYSTQELKSILLDDIYDVIETLQMFKDQLINHNTINEDFEKVANILKAALGKCGDEYEYEDVINELDEDLASLMED